MFFKVISQKRSGHKRFYRSRLYIVNLLVPTSSPTITNVRVLSSTSLEVSWTPIDSRNDTSSSDTKDAPTEIIQYKIQWRPFFNQSFIDPDDSQSKSDESTDGDIDHEWEALIRDANSLTEIKLENLQPYQMYEIRIAAGNAVGFGPFGDVIMERTRGDGKGFVTL